MQYIKALSKIFVDSMTTHADESEEEQTASPIDTLPPEILIQVFAYLPLQALGSCAIVCKKWHELSQDNFLWKPQCLNFNLPNAEHGLSQVKSFNDAFEKGNILYRTPAINCRALEETQFGVLKGKFYASATLKPDDPIKIWDLETNEVVTTFDNTKNLEDINNMHFHDDYLALSIKQGKKSMLMIFGLLEGSPIEVQLDNCHTMVCHKGVIAAFTNKWGDATIYLIDVATGKIRHELPHDGMLGSSIYFSDKRLASGDAFDTNRIWDIETGKCLYNFPHDGGAHNLLIQKEIFISTYNNKVKVCDLQKKSSYTIKVNGNIQSIDLQGNILAMRLDDGCIALLNIINKKITIFNESKDAEAKGKTLGKIKWSGFKLFVVLSNNSLQIWDFSNESQSTFSKMRKWIP